MTYESFMALDSIWQWILILIAIALVAYPLAIVLRRTGHSGWWALLYFVPLLNLIGLWVWAFKKWPNQE